jgi:hypothetical protein
VRCFPKRMRARLGMTFADKMLKMAGDAQALG